jgi:hypothetical protein
MLKSVPYLAALSFSALLISLSAHADTPEPSLGWPQIYPFGALARILLSYLAYVAFK